MGPSFGKGCLIVIGGAALGFFGCLGAANLFKSAENAIGAALVATAVGALIMGIGIKQMIAAAIRSRRKVEPRN